MYCRIVHLRHAGLDDYFMLAALVVAIALGVMNGFHVSWGTGYKVAMLTAKLTTADEDQATWGRLGRVSDTGSDAATLVCLSTGVPMGAILR